MNWKAEAMEKLRKYDAMRQATQNIPEEITRLELAARSIRSARTDGTAVKGGGSKREEMLWGSDKQTYGHFNFILIMISLAALPSTLRPLGKKLVPTVCT